MDSSPSAKEAAAPSTSGRPAAAAADTAANSELVQPGDWVVFVTGEGQSRSHQLGRVAKGSGKSR